MDEGAELNRTDTCLQSNNSETFQSGPGLNRGQCLFKYILPSETATQILLWVFVLLTVFSLLVNACALLGLGHSKDLSWEPRFTLLKNLISSDLLLILTQAPTVIRCLLLRSTLPYGVWCMTQYFVETVCIFNAIITITCMALERYIYVCQAIYYLHILTSRRLRFILGFTWLLSATISAVTFVLMSCGHRSSLLGEWTTGLLCEPDTLEVHLGFPRAAAVFRKVSGFAVTALCICTYSFAYLRMYQEARNAVQPFQQVNRRARSTVLFYCSMFLLQLMPIFIKIASDALWELEATLDVAALYADSPGWTSTGMLHVMLLLLLQVPPCINPLIYGLRNREVRQALSRIIWWRTARQEVHVDT